jgi:hypothetical protein
MKISGFIKILNTSLNKKNKIKEITSLKFEEIGFILKLLKI